MGRGHEWWPQSRGRADEHKSRAVFYEGNGLAEADRFHLDPGRLCVLLTRHRQACVVVGRAGDRGLLNDRPPPPAAYLDWNPDAVLDGWEVHREVFAALEPVRVGI